MPSRRYWKKFRRPGTGEGPGNGVSPLPNVALVFSDGSWILEPEGTTGSIGDTTTVAQKVIWARPDRVGAVFKDGPDNWVEYDFEARQELGGIRSAIAQVLWTGQKWLIEWHLPGGGICNSSAARYWGDSVTDSIGWSLAANRPNFRAMAVDRAGGRAWVAAEGGGSVTIHESAISPPGCSIASWPTGGLNIVGLAWLYGHLYGTDSVSGTYRLYKSGNHINIWWAKGAWLFASAGVLWNFIDSSTPALHWFDPDTGETGMYKTYASFPRYVVVFG